MTRPAGKAAIQIVGDAGDFAKSLQRDLNRALRTLDVDVKPLTNKLIAGAKTGVAGVERAFEGLNVKVDRTFDKLAGDADRAFDKIAGDAAKSGLAIGNRFQAAGETAENAMEELDRAAGVQFSQMTTKAGISASAISSRYTAAFAVIKGAALAATTAAVAGLAGMTAFGLKSAAAIEQTTIGLEALLGSAAEAKKFLVELQKFSAATPFEFGDVADASRRILAFGTSVGIARDQVIPTLTTIGDLVSVLGGTAENAQSVIRALGQIASKGKLSQEEILQLAEALPGFNANAAIASATGLSVADTLAKITRGEIDAKTGINALLAGMAKFPGAAGAMAKQSQTLQGVFSTFKDTISIALSDAFTPVIPAIKETLTKITPVIGDAVKILAPALGEFLTKLLPLIASAVQALSPILGIFVDLAGTLAAAVAPAFAKLAPIVQRLVDGLAPLVVVLGEFFAKAIDELVASGALDQLVDLLLQLVPPLIDLLLAVMPLLGPLAKLIALFLQSQQPLIELIALWVSFASTKAAPVIADLAEKIGGLLDKLLEAGEVVKDVKNWPDLLSKFGDVVGPIFEDAKTAVGDFFSSVGTWFSELPDKIGEFLSELPGKIETFMTDLFNRGLHAIGFGIGQWIGAMLSIPPLMLGALVSLGHTIGDFFTGLWADVKAKAAEAWNALVQSAMEAPGKFWAALQTLPDLVSAQFQAAFTRAKAWVDGKIGEIAATLNALPDRISALAGRMAAAGLNMIKGLFSGLSQAGGFVGNLAGAIVSNVKALLNRVIAGINSGIASIDDALPFSLPRIPQLATGGLTTAEGVANLHPRELVLPLEDRRAVDLLAAAMREAQAGLAAAGVPGAAPQFEVNVLLSPESFKELARVEIRETNRATKARVTARSGRR